MQEVIKELDEIIVEFTKKIRGFSEVELAEKPQPNKWSKKEVLGHLIDSGQSNLRRFILCQQAIVPPKIVYDQDFWVKANNYQQVEGKDLIDLWRLMNLQISNVLSTMQSDKYTKTCDTAKDTVQLRSLEWLATDYVKHMKHHLNQIIKGSFDIIYP